MTVLPKIAAASRRAIESSMTLWEARRISATIPLAFGDERALIARDILRVYVDIRALQREMVYECCEWNDLPDRGDVYGDSTAEDLEAKLACLQAMAREHDAFFVDAEDAVAA